jgi:hypothetical protein
VRLSVYNQKGVITALLPAPLPEVTFVIARFGRMLSCDGLSDEEQTLKTSGDEKWQY